MMSLITSTDVKSDGKLIVSEFESSTLKFDSNW